jgi:hypothetical protein
LPLSHPMIPHPRADRLVCGSHRRRWFTGLTLSRTQRIEQ